MATTPPPGYQRAIPYFITKDPGAVMDFAIRALGFTEKERMALPDGSVMHGEVSYGENVVMLGACRPGVEGFKSMVYVYVDDVDAHHAHATSQSAEIASELQDQFYGDRSYGVTDPDGNQWHFATCLKHMTPEELREAMAGMMGGGD